MPQFYKGDDINLVGGRPRVVMMPFSSPAPAQLGEIIDLSTYALNATYNWVEMGLTDGGVDTGFGATSTEWRTDQFGLVKVQPNEYSGHFKVTMMEFDYTHKQNWIAMAGAEADVASGTQKVTAYTTKPFFSAKRIAVLTLDDAGFVHALVFPKAYWRGTPINRAYMPDQPVKQSLEWLAVPDDNKVGADGHPMVAYDFDKIS